jgi:hypothetical protein
VVYRIEGALFFGAAAKAMSELELVGAHVRVSSSTSTVVPVMDATGLVEPRERPRSRPEERRPSSSSPAPSPSPRSCSKKLGIKPERDVLEICKTVEEAVELARAIRAAAPPSMLTPMPHPAS